MSSSTRVVDALIVGAGMSGLMAARQLLSIGEVILLDKREQVGGRMTTRPVGPGVADLGVQFFTVHTPEFESLTMQWLADGVIEQWATGWSDASLTDASAKTYRRYIVGKGMSTLAQNLARSLTVYTGACVERVVRNEDIWELRTTNGDRYACRALLLTPPVPLSIRLLQAGQVELSYSDLAALQNVTYDPCFVATFWLDGETKLPGLGAIQLPIGPIRYLVDNQRKGISPDATIVTVQADTTYSRQLWDVDDEDILDDIRVELRTYLLPDTKIIESRLHRWRYAIPLKLHPQPCLVAGGLPTLVFAGDAFGALRGIEGAALSGLAAGRTLIGLLQDND
jgi:renalase